jgi:anti-anti-sigma factor
MPIKPGTLSRMLDPSVRLIAVSGALELATERRLRSDLREAAGDRSRELVIDLRGVTFIDSSGLAVLVHADQQFRRQGRAMACVIRPGPVERLLDAAGLRDALHLFGTPEEAAAHVLRATHSGQAKPPGQSGATDIGVGTLAR